MSNGLFGFCMGMVILRLFRLEDYLYAIITILALGIRLYQLARDGRIANDS